MGCIFQRGVDQFGHHPLPQPITIRKGRVIRSRQQFHFGIVLQQRCLIRNLRSWQTGNVQFGPWCKLQQCAVQFALVSVIDHRPFLRIAKIALRNVENGFVVSNNMGFCAILGQRAADPK